MASGLYLHEEFGGSLGCETLAETIRLIGVWKDQQTVEPASASP